jgi:hypothetical protein
MKKTIAFFFLSILLISCENSVLKTPVPEDVIPVDTLIMVIGDIMVMEKVIQKDYSQLVRNTEIVRNSGDSILRNYHLNYDRYQRSLAYYTTDMDTMNYIYDKISDRATIQLNELGN